MPRVRSYLFVLCTLLAVGCGGSPSSDPTASSEDALSPVDNACTDEVTQAGVKTLESQGFTRASEHNQRVVSYSFGTTLYWRDSMSYRYEHKDGRVKYATCHGVLGPDFPVKTKSKIGGIWVSDTVERSERWLVNRGRGTATWYPADFTLDGVTGWNPTLTGELFLETAYGQRFFHNAALTFAFDAATQELRTSGNDDTRMTMHMAPDGTILRFKGLGFVTPPVATPERTLASCSGTDVVSTGTAVRVGKKTYPIADVNAVTSAGGGWEILAMDPSPYPLAQPSRDFRVFTVGPNASGRMTLWSSGYLLPALACGSVDTDAWNTLARGNLDAPQLRVITIVDVGVKEDIRVLPSDTISVDPSGLAFVLRNESSFDIELSGVASPTSGEIYARKGTKTDELQMSALPGGFVKLVPYPGKEHYVRFVR